MSEVQLSAARSRAESTGGGGSAPETEDAGSGYAHSKAILLGEHSVVYGAPAIAIPVEALGVHAWANPRADGLYLESDLYTGDRCETEHQTGPVRAAVAASLEATGQPGAGVSVRLHSTIPFARGLGSSAAVGAAIGRAIASMAGRELDPEQLNTIIQAAETVAHGKPSGLDARTVVADSPIRFQSGEVSAISVGGEFDFVIADTGVTGSTAEAVESVRVQREAEPGRVEGIISQLAALADAAVGDLTSGAKTALGEKISAVHGLLASIRVSSPLLDSLVAEANAAGALGAKLTGGGLGGCIMALAPSGTHAEQIREALYRAGAVHTWHTKVVP